ncbi:MAG: fused MFS/spermidine synthase [Pirellulaceae bacterium]|nr:fused MFS/spermidine synthase [Pirellulaceae bacterium]
MYRYALTIFLSAFLLFQVQPMVARFILPWFGGAALVWTTCMLFFQVVLVAGYAYSHIITNRLNPRTQWILHFVLVATAILLLPIRPGEHWKPLDGTLPTWRILALLSAVVALPFFVLSTTGPLIQKWQSQTHADRSPYRLFALSNLASLAALVTYPLFVETYLTLDQQAGLWSVLFFIFGCSVVWSGYRFQQVAKGPSNAETSETTKNTIAEMGWVQLSFLTVALWLVLPFLASVQLLATTNLMTQEVGSHPFLWILPLALYLLTFIICFDREFWYVRPFFQIGLVVFGFLASMVYVAGADVPATFQIISYAVVLFFAAMCCHGELARVKPNNRYLTLYYLLIAVGGALGGVFVALLAPVLFVEYDEFPLSLIGVVLVCVSCLFGPGSFRTYRPIRRWQWVGYGICFLGGAWLILFVSEGLYVSRENGRDDIAIASVRNEYGLLKVNQDSDDESYPLRRLMHGQIRHGLQVQSETFSNLATSYYSSNSGVGRAIRYFQASGDDKADDGLHIGAIGLGTGTLAAWTRSMDSIHFFEINPAVEDIARSHFSYLRDCEGESKISLGDARIQLEREAKEHAARRYHVLVADAFSSDSIPIHLLTLEALQLYKERITENGVIAIHTSNRFLVLENVVRRLAEEIGMKAYMVEDHPQYRSAFDPDKRIVVNLGRWADNSSWVLLTNNPNFLDSEEMDDIRDNVDNWADEIHTVLWTDDFAPLAPVVMWDWSTDWYDDAQRSWRRFMPDFLRQLPEWKSENKVAGNDEDEDSSD